MSLYKDLNNLSDTLSKITSENSIYFIKQAPFLNTSILCDEIHHANSIGRKIRTQDLLSAYELNL